MCVIIFSLDHEFVVVMLYAEQILIFIFFDGIFGKLTVAINLISRFRFSDGLELILILADKFK